ncbi:hypothetical protein ACFL6R_03220 [Gemmatimonadota bacterium]
MQRTLTTEDIEQIADVLGTEAKFEADHWTLLLDSPEQQRHIRVELYPDIQIGKETGSLVSVYTHNSHLQLHFVSGYVVSTLLGEVTFIAERKGWVSGLTVEREAACSLYSNVDNSVLSGDFTRLGPEVMLSGIALCLTDGIMDLLDEEDEPAC